jgi:hypothetical protein
MEEKDPFFGRVPFLYIWLENGISFSVYLDISTIFKSDVL